MTGNNARCPLCGDRFVKYHERTVTIEGSGGFGNTLEVWHVRNDAEVCSREFEEGMGKEIWVHLSEENLSLSGDEL